MRERVMSGAERLWCWARRAVRELAAIVCVATATCALASDVPILTPPNNLPPLTDPDPTRCGTEHVSVPSATPTPECDDAELPSHCYWFLSTRYTVGGQILPGLGAPIGFPLNMDLREPPGLGTFLPPAPYVGATSLALMPPELARESTSWRGVSRPTVQGAIDLATGAPLAQFTDLELPLDGATFRLTRTRSVHRAAEPDSVFDTDGWWDWVGQGWMSSEAPILLVDSQTPDVHAPGSRVTYLVLDAHHTIPFVRLSEGRYEAPARFRATLQTAGDPVIPGSRDYGRDNLGTIRQRYIVSLYDGALTYEFHVRAADMPAGGSPPDLQSLHAPHDWGGTAEDPFPPGPGSGLGIPYLALLQSIKDRHGRRVEFTYEDARFTNFDNAATADCVECQQSCGDVGRLREIRLYSGSGELRWTLVYRYRQSFSFDYNVLLTDALDDGTRNELEAIRGQRWVESIFVYEGAPPSGWAPSEADRTIPLTAGHVPPPSAWNDEVEADHLRNEVVEPTAFAGWKHRVRYHHSLRDERDTGACGIEVSDRTGMIAQHPLLLMSSVTTKSEIPGEEPQARTHVFDYAYARVPLGTQNWLSALYEPEDVQVVLNALAQQPEAPPGVDAAWLAQRLHEDSTDDTIALRFATVQWHAADQDRSAPSAELAPFIGAEVGTVFGSGESMIAKGVTLRDETGTRRTYHVRRFVTGNEPGIATNPPLPSAYFAPFLYRTYSPRSGPPDLTQPRWISVIDEVAHDGPQLGQAEGQPVQSRRVLRISPSGQVLHERTWRRKDGQLVFAERSGIGEETVYRQVAEFLPEGYFGELRGEVVPVEVRSTGWSVVPSGSEGSDGLIAFMEHEVLPRGSQVPHDELRLEVLARGIRRGTDGAKYYTHQVIRPDDKPHSVPGLSGEWLVEHDVRFLEPVTTPLPSTGWSIPDAPTGGTISRAVTTVLTRREPADTGEPWYYARVVDRIEIAPPVQQRPGGVWYYPVRRTLMDSRGRPSREFVGLVRDPLNPAPDTGAEQLGALAVTLHVYSEQGNPLHRIVDVDLGSAGLPDPSVLNQGRPEEARVTDEQLETIADDELGWTPFRPNLAPSDPSAAPVQPANLVTTWMYDGSGGRLSDIYFPSGRRWASRVVVITYDESGGSLPREDWFAREFVFNELEQRPGASGTQVEWVSRMPGEIRDYSEPHVDGPPRTVTRVLWATAASTPDAEVQTLLRTFLDTPSEWLQPASTPEQAIEYAHDSSGRAVQAHLLEPDASGALRAVGSVEIQDLIDQRRELAMDGTITRVTRNPIGQEIRTYVGTVDSNQQMARYDTLALTSRVAYGAGPSNALLPTHRWTYTKNPPWAANQSTLYDDISLSDADGILTLTQYDWRMRPVRVDEFAPGNVRERLTTTLTYYDHADRVRLTVTYGKGALSVGSSVDPVSVPSPGVVNIDSEAIRALMVHAGIAPVSVVEHVYGASNEPTETRTYALSEAGVPQFHAQVKFAGVGGRQVYSASPQSPTMRSIVDGLGRTRSTASSVLLGGVWTELERSDYVVDADGNVVDTASWERTKLDLSGVLSLTNAVRTRTVSWFDPKKRRTATAQLGTEDADGLYVAAQPAYIRPVNDGNLSEPYLDFAGQDPIVRNGVPASAQLSLDVYSILSGRLTRTVAPDRTITRIKYDSAGRVKERIENEFPEAGEQARTTSYEYTFGRMTGVEVSTGTGPSQVTRLLYGARILPEGPLDQHGIPTYALDGPQIHHSGLIGHMFLPDGGGTTLPEASKHFPPHSNDPIFDLSDVRLSYTFDGLVAERTDARGVTMRYIYDDLRRLSWVVVGRYVGGEFKPEYVPMGGDTDPVDRVMAVEYRYDEMGRLSDVIARGGVKHVESVLSHNRYEYDIRGNLIREWQSHGEWLQTAPDPRTPHIDYTWSYLASDHASGVPGHDRLTSITYPGGPGFPLDLSTNLYVSRRTIQFEYGNPDSIDHLLSRITAMRSVQPGAPQSIARFRYTGVSRRFEQRLGSDLSGIITTLQTGAREGLAGLDSFGRVRDLHTTSVPAGNQVALRLLRTVLTRNHAGSVVGEDITQWTPPPGTLFPYGDPHLRSATYSYDAFQRLVGSQSSGMGRADSWSLDHLGNWIGTPTLSGRRTTGVLDNTLTGDSFPAGAVLASGMLQPWLPLTAPDASPDVLDFRPEVSARNEIEAVAVGSDSNTQFIEILHDAAGNVIYDGTFVYFYDAWNRLVQVNAGSRNTSVLAPALTPYDGLRIGPMLKHFTYDGLGRLIRTQSPFPDPAAALADHIRSERHYYDGARRIQDIRVDPVITLGMALVAGGEIEELALEAKQQAEDASGLVGPGSSAQLSGDSTPIMLEEGIIEMGLEQQVGAMTSGTLEPAENGPRLTREYVWGPGGAMHPASVDELLVYFGDHREMLMVVHDAAGDVAAIVADGRAGPVAQMRYDPYGQLIAKDVLAEHADLAVGHRGLFFERLDIGVAESGQQGGRVFTPPGRHIARIENPTLTPFARGIYHMRNRTLLPGGGSPGLIGVESWRPAAPPAPPGTFELNPIALGSLSPIQGRFAQADPHATALPVMRELPFHGEAFGPGIDQFDLEARFIDGANLYQYLGSSPYGATDPSGLFIGQIIETYGAVATTAGRLAYMLVSTYAANLRSDLDWASDWTLPDDFYTRLDASWIGEVYSTVDVNQTVDESWNIFASRFPGSYVKGTKKVVAGLRGKLKHHAFMRHTTRFFSDVKEIMVELPPGAHRDFHRDVEKILKKRLPGIPSLYHPGGPKRWAEFMAVPGNPERYIIEFGAAIRQWERANASRYPNLKNRISKAFKESMSESKVRPIDEFIVD